MPLTADRPNYADVVLPFVFGLSTQQVAKIVYSYIGVDGGYLGDFSYATHAQFYPLYCDLDINPYDLEGTTRERFTAILTGLRPHDQAKVIRGVVERFLVGAPGPATRTDRLRDDLLPGSRRTWRASRFPMAWESTERRSPERLPMPKCLCDRTARSAASIAFTLRCTAT